VEVFTTTAADAGRELEVPAGDPVDRDGVKVTYFPRWRRFKSRFVSWPLAKACAKRSSDYDVVHVVGLWTFPAWIASRAARRAGIPTVVSLHGMLMTWPRQHHQWRKAIFMALWERQRLSHAQVVICTSELEQRQFREAGLGIETAIIPNAVSAPALLHEGSRGRFRNRYNLQDADVFLFAGRVVKNKGLHLTIEAFAQAIEDCPRAHLIVVGPFEDNSEQEAVQQVRDLNLENRVHLLGMLSGSDYWDAMAGADVFVLNSYSENFAVAPAEALAIGVPVLLSDQVGLADWVSQYRAGVVVPLEVAATAEAMTTMLADKVILREMGRNSARLVHEQFSPDAVGRRFAALLGDVVAKTGGQSEYEV
jgi:glycosyltransferase involved in cell wall biosynthesis